jgi:hypothetical protein
MSVGRYGIISLSSRYTARDVLYNVSIKHFCTTKNIHWSLHRQNSLVLKLITTKKWKNNIDEMVPKLCGAYYAARSVLHISKTIYFAHFHS